MIKQKIIPLDLPNLLEWYDILENKKFLKELKFEIGSEPGLYYYLYNYQNLKIEPENLGLVML